MSKFYYKRGLLESSGRMYGLFYCEVCFLRVCVIKRIVDHALTSRLCKNASVIVVTESEINNQPLVLPLKTLVLPLKPLVLPLKTLTSIKKL